MSSVETPVVTVRAPLTPRLVELLSGECRYVPILTAIALIWFFFGAMDPKFLSPRNLPNLSLQSIVTGTLALGLVPALIIRQIDMSVAPVSAVAATITGQLLLVFETSVWLAIAAGVLSEIVAIVGDNGAGKSTLIKAISGTQPPDEGAFFFNGQPVAITSPQDASRLGIETVYQNLALCDNLDTVQNLFLGNEITTSASTGRRLRRAAMERLCREAPPGSRRHDHSVAAHDGRAALWRPATGHSDLPLCDAPPKRRAARRADGRSERRVARRDGAAHPQAELRKALSDRDIARP
jgi:predicted ABC-type transport system involved in lysophospholipase L1 biosynthesis ATPase subunit